MAAQKAQADSHIVGGDAPQDALKAPVADGPSPLREGARCIGEGSQARLSVREILALQRLAGNGAVSRLMESASAPPPTSEPQASPSLSTAPTEDRRTALAEATAAFTRHATDALGLDSGFAARLQEPETSRPAPQGDAQVAKEAKSEIAQATTKLRADAVAIKAQTATAQPPPPPPPKRPQNAVPPDQQPEAVASAADAQRVPTSGMDIPLDEAKGAGPSTTSALASLEQVASENPALVKFGQALAGRIADLRDRAAANAVRAAGELKQKAGDQRAGVRAAIRNSAEAVTGALAGAKGHIDTSATAAKGALGQRATRSHAAVADVTRAETTRLSESMAGGTARAKAAFADADKRVAEGGEAEAKAGRDHGYGLAEKAIALGKSEAARHRATEEDTELGADKASAVLEVAQRFASQLRGDADSLAKDVRAQAAKAREQVGAEAEPAVKGVAEVGKGSVEGIRSFLGAVDDSLDGVASQGHEHIDSARTAVAAEVANQEKAAQSRGIALRAQGEAAVDAALAAGLVDEAKLAGQAAELVDTTGRDALDQLANVAGGRTPLPVQRKPSGVQADEEPSEALDQLDEMGPALDNAAKDQSREVEESVSGAAAGASQAGTHWAGETKTNMSKLGATASTAFGEAVATVGGQLENTVATGRTKAASEVDKVASAVDARVSEVKSSVDAGASDAVASLRGGASEGKSHADQTHAQLPAALNQAAASQESLLGKVGNWFSEQLAQTWQAIQGMCDWRFVVSLAVGIGVALLVAVTVAALILSAPFSMPALLAVIIVGAAAGAAGFAASQVTSNVLDPDPNKKWYDGVGRAAILGAFVGAAGAVATFKGMTLAAGALLVMGAAGVGTIVSNLATGKEWDDHLLANILIIGIFHSVLKGVSDRLPGRGTGRSGEKHGTTPYDPPAPGTVEVVVDSAARVKASEFVRTVDGYECKFTDSQTGARFGDAVVEVDASGSPTKGPSLTIDPTNARAVDGSPVKLVNKGFSWTDACLREVMRAFRKKFGRGPAKMGGLIAWENLRIFQEAFAKARAAGMSEKLAAEHAARQTPFGKLRIKLGYGKLSVKYDGMQDVTVRNPKTGVETTLKDVPTNVYIEAEPTVPGPLPTVPEDDEEMVEAD